VCAQGQCLGREPVNRRARMLLDTEHYLNDSASRGWARVRNARPGARERLWRELASSGEVRIREQRCESLPLGATLQTRASCGDAAVG
jgi:hypothetical protein